MVEGPGCKVKGEVMRKRITGKIVRNVIVPVKSNQTVKNENSKHNQLSVLCGQEVKEIRTLGKELFIFFAHCAVCVRIHFLMVGSVRYGKVTNQTSAQMSDPSLIISFSDDELFVFKSAIDLRPAEDSFKHCNFLADVDICSPLFNFERAQKLVEEKQSELICDVIMDQAILPGVGNIIKNEGLFKSGINPNTFVRDLSSNLIAFLINRLRDFSAIFYMCRKKNKSLVRHLCIYEKKKCLQCSEKVTVCKPGTLNRLTFYCSLCQVNSSKSSHLSLPKKNSILGFLQYSDAPSIPNDCWTCSSCTYINQPPLKSCEMCFTQISGSIKRKLPEQYLGLENPIKRQKLDINPGAGDSKNRNGSFIPCHDTLEDTLKKKDLKSVPMCPGHHKECSLKVVTREGENKGRLFYCCSLGAQKQCKFFQWGDLHHPLCTHGKRSILRRVLKQNDNNGKEFFCCPFPKGKQCKFFQWAESA